MQSLIIRLYSGVKQQILFLGDYLVFFQYNEYFLSSFFVTTFILDSEKY